MLAKDVSKVPKKTSSKEAGNAKEPKVVKPKAPNSEKKGENISAPQNVQQLRAVILLGINDEFGRIGLDDYEIELQKPISKA